MQTNMADDQENGLMEETGNHSLNTDSVVVTASGIAVVDSEGVSEDILQQAFVGTEDFDQEAVSYDVQADAGDVSQSVGQQIVNTVVSDSGLGPSTQFVASDNEFGTTTYRVVSTLQDGTISLPDDLIAQTVASESGNTEQLEENQAGEVTLIGSEGQPVLEGQQVLLTVGGDQQQFQETADQHLQDGQEECDETEEQPQQEQQTLRFTVMESTNHTGAPLGSSQNPIRIIQQGNNYTPVQQLTGDQLHQIMQVVQQQQVAKNTQESGGSVLFNPNTNTRIVYRVIYPSELHKGQQTVLHVTPRGTTTTTSIPVQQAQLPKRQYRKRKDEEEDKLMDGPEMSKEEKEERKKHRPRTRSGRVSKPPKHMVKDYKHIHVLDWDEDYDDSDGGYSDYKGSDEEGHGRSKDKNKEVSPELYSGLAMSSSRPKNYKCQTCDKSYIGQAGLGRHYRLTPSHGSLPEVTGENGEKANGETVSADNTPVMNNGSTPISSTPKTVGNCTAASSVGSSAGNLSEDSNTQDSIPSSSGAVSPITTRTPQRGRGGFRGRGRWSFQHHTAPARKKQKLKELLKTIEDDDLMEVVLPRLVKFVTLWEFMLMKLETCNGAHPRVDHIYREFLGLHKHVKQACHEGLQFKQACNEELQSKQACSEGLQSKDAGQVNGLDGQESREGDPDVLKFEDDAIAKSLGLTTGLYEIKDLPVNEYTSFRYKYLTSDPNGPPGVSAEKRTIQVVTPDELVSQSPNKRSRVTSLLHSSSSSPATITLAPAAAAASSLLTSIVTNSGLKGQVNKQQGVFRTVAIQQPQTSLLQTVTVQQPQTHLLQNVPVQQPPTVLRTVALQPQQQATAVLRTINMPSQSHDHSSTVLRTVTMQSQAQPAQTSLLRSVQQPLVVSPSKQHNRQGVIGVSLLNTSSASSHPSVTVLKTVSGQASGSVIAASVSPSVTGSTFSEIPQSQAAQVVSVQPQTVTTSFSGVHHTTGSVTSDITAMAPDDFMDTSGDSLVGSLSGLSSANSSLVTSISSSLPNGEMTELGFSSIVKVNGVSDPAKSNSVLMDKVQNCLLNDATATSHNSEQISVSNTVQPENGELHTVTTPEDDAFQLSASTLLTTGHENTILAVSRQLNSAQGTAQVVNVKHAEGSALLSDGATKVELMDHGDVADVVANAKHEEESALLPDGSTQVANVKHAEESALLPDGSLKVELMDHGDVADVVNNVIDEGDAQLEVEESMEGQAFTLHQNATLFQTEDGTVILQNPDGTTFQLQGVGDQGLTLESVQELLGQMVAGDQLHTELQQ